jgi:hypothetical protein
MTADERDYYAGKHRSQEAAEVCWAGIGIILLASAVVGCIRWVFS